MTPIQNAENKLMDLRKRVFQAENELRALRIAELPAPGQRTDYRGEMVEVSRYSWSRGDRSKPVMIYRRIKKNGEPYAVEQEAW